jgi:hypothetical protein
MACLRNLAIGALSRAGPSTSPLPPPPRSRPARPVTTLGITLG